jgi:hypothetical protein
MNPEVVLHIVPRILKIFEYMQGITKRSHMYDIKEIYQILWLCCGTDAKV